jgi:acyl-ACP thioesterase
MKYRYNYIVQYQEVDDTRRLRLYTMENYLLNVAGRVAGELGFGIQALMPLNCTWIITHLNLEMLYLPVHGEEMIIETWIEKNAHMLSVRDFRIYIKESEAGQEPRLIGCAKTVWAVLEQDKREIVNLFDNPMFAGSVDGEVLRMARAQRLLPIDMDKAREDAEVILVKDKKHTIQYADMDYNCHCNSCKYLEWMLNARRMQDNASPFRLDINYVKELYLEDQLITKLVEKEGSVQYQQVDQNGTTCCSARITQIDNLSC